MANTVKFRFGDESVLGISFKCKNCSVCNILSVTKCPVLEYTYSNSDLIPVQDDNPWWGNRENTNIGIIADDLALRWCAYKKCKNLATLCPYKKQH